MDDAALATRKLDAAASNSNAAVSKGRLLKNCHLILEQAFKVIPLGKVSYKSLVSAKNNKHTSLNQNLDN